MTDYLSKKPNTINDMKQDPNALKRLSHQLKYELDKSQNKTLSNYYKENIIGLFDKPILPTDKVSLILNSKNKLESDHKKKYKMYTTNRNNIRQIMIMIMIICCIISYVVYNYRSSVSNNIKNNKQDEVSNSQKNTVKSIDKYKPVIVEHINNLMKNTNFNFVETSEDENAEKKYKVKQIYFLRKDELFGDSVYNYVFLTREKYSSVNKTREQIINDAMVMFQNNFIKLSCTKNEKDCDKYKNNFYKNFNECLDYDDCNIIMFVKSSKPKRTNQLNNFVITSKLKPVPRPNIKANFKPKDDCNIQFL
jgi:hypothetical protein